MSEYNSRQNDLQEKCEALEAEVQIYRNAASLYGIDAITMLTLAKSQIKTCADNIRLMEKVQEVFELFNQVPTGLTDSELEMVICQYDGDISKPYCDLVRCGLDIIRKYLEKRSEYDEWQKSNLPFSV